MGQWELPFLWVGWKLIQVLWKTLPVSTKVKSMPTLWASNSPPRYKPNKIECLCSPEDVHNIHNNYNCNSPKMKTTQMSINNKIEFLNGDLFVQCILNSSENKLQLYIAIWVNLTGTVLKKSKCKKTIHAKWFYLHPVGNQQWWWWW